MGLEWLGKAVISSVVFSLLGMAVFAAGFLLLRLLLPMDMKKEIEIDQNTSLGIIIGSFVLGLAFIVGMAIHGGP
jgi:putative membrane protein